jgi:hypothetical protein
MMKKGGNYIKINDNGRFRLISSRENSKDVDA